MVAALELQNLVAPAVRPRRPHGEQGRLGAAAGESDLFGGGDGAADLFRKENGLFRQAEEGEALADALAQGIHDLRVSVANEHRPGP